MDAKWFRLGKYQKGFEELKDVNFKLVAYTLQSEAGNDSGNSC